MIGIILLIGIVKKNAIMMIDFALDAERNEGKQPEESIYQACLLRFRPIMMTTMAAMLGGIPIAMHGQWRGVAPSAGNRYCRRTHIQPDADALYDPGRIHLSGSIPRVDYGPKKLRPIDVIPPLDTTPPPAHSASD